AVETETAIETAAMIATEMVTGIGIVTQTIAIVSLSTMTPSPFRERTIRITTTAKALTRLVTTTAYSPAPTMRGVLKLTSRNAHTFTAKPNEVIVPAKAAAPSINKRIVTVSCTAIAKASNIGKFISLAGSLDRDTIIFREGT